MFVDRQKDLPDNLVLLFNEAGSSLSLGDLSVHRLEWMNDGTGKNTRALISGNPKQHVKGQRWVWFDRLDFTRWFRRYTTIDGVETAVLGEYHLDKEITREDVIDVLLNDVWLDRGLGKTVDIKDGLDHDPSEVFNWTTTLLYLDETVVSTNGLEVRFTVDLNHGFFGVLIEGEPLTKAVVYFTWDD